MAHRPNPFKKSAPGNKLTAKMADHIRAGKFGKKKSARKPKY